MFVSTAPGRMALQRIPSLWKRHAVCFVTQAADAISVPNV
jgi:hypothetical protein